MYTVSGTVSRWFWSCVWNTLSHGYANSPQSTRLSMGVSVPWEHHRTMPSSTGDPETHPLTMDWSWRILYLVAVATAKGQPSPWTQERTRTSQHWFHPLLSPLYRCALPGFAGAVWGWSEEAWGISEDLLQSIWIQLHWLLYALGATGSCTRAWVDGKHWPWRWFYKLCTKVPERTHSDSRHIHKHSLHGAKQSEVCRHGHVLLCKDTVRGCQCEPRHKPPCRRRSGPPGVAHYAPFCLCSQEQVQVGVVGRFCAMAWGFLSIQQFPPGSLSGHMILCLPTRVWFTKFVLPRTLYLHEQEIESLTIAYPCTKYRWFTRILMHINWTFTGVPGALTLHLGPQDPTVPRYPHPALVLVKHHGTSFMSLRFSELYMCYSFLQILETTREKASTCISQDNPEEQNTKHIGLHD